MTESFAWNDLTPDQRQKIAAAAGFGDRLAEEIAAARWGNLLSRYRGRLMKVDWRAALSSSASKAATQCQCEQVSCGHGDTCCTESAFVDVKTIYGTFKMCLTCAASMPEEYLCREAQ